jgi:chemotaxis protein methyltransferase CheR
MAMVLSEYAENQRGFRFSILASDISTRVLQTALMAIYPESRIEPVPLELRKKYMLRSKNQHEAQVRFTPEIRRKIRFERINFMELDNHPPEKFHVIFCRNVIIYFDRTTQEQLLNRFAQRLEPGGYLFLGHSEALTGMRVPLQGVAPMVYRKN